MKQNKGKGKQKVNGISAEMKLAQYVPQIFKCLERLGVEGMKRVLRSALELVESGSFSSS